MANPRDERPLTEADVRRIVDERLAELGRPRAGALLTVPEAAAYLGLGVDFVRGLMEDRLVPLIRQRGRYYVARVAIDEWLRPAPPSSRPWSSDP
jgi:excisionase family DNA binding protein